MDNLSAREDALITSVFRSQPSDYLTPEEVAKLTPAIVAQRVRALKPLFAAHSDATERNRRPSDDVWRALIKTGYFYLTIPKRYGGLQANIEQIIDATMPIGEADPSLGWLACFSLATPRPASAYPIEVQDMLFSGGKTPIFTNLIAPVCKAKKVPGGYRITGRWAWCTTIQFADYVNMFCVVENEDGSMGGVQTFLAPASAVTIYDTWRANGMVGTGTHHAGVDDLFVPDNMVAVATNSEDEWAAHVTKYHPDYPLFLTTPAPGFAIFLAIPVIAAAAGAVEAARDHLQRYTKRGSVMPEREKMRQQMRLGEAFTKAKAAELLVREAARAIYNELPFMGAEKLDLYHQSRAYMGQACDLCRETAQLLMQSMGTSVHYTDSRMGRFFRDVMTGASHTGCDYDITTHSLGQVMLGIAPTTKGHITDPDSARNEIAASRGEDFSLLKAIGGGV